jgi:hypothetical protein
VVLIVGIALVFAYVVGVIVSGMKPQLGQPSLASTQGVRIDMILAHQEAFLDVVLWAMGLVATLAVLLVGYRLGPNGKIRAPREEIPTDPSLLP